MTSQTTVGELKEALEDIPDDEPVNVQLPGGVGEVTKIVGRNADGFLLKAR